jgi:CRISPR-associated protein Csy3
MTTLKTASVLAFERNLDISDAFLWQTDSANLNMEAPVRVRNKSVRGTISNRLKSAIANDPVKLDAEIEKPNLQTVEVTALDADRNTLVVKWSCKVLPFTGKPSACNDPEYQERLMAVVREYLDEHGVSELARRYAANIANGRWLWRNRLGAETIEITIKYKIDGEQKQIVFDSARSLSLVDFNADDPAHRELAALIEKGMTGDRAVMLNVSARVDVGYGQEVFPSQELILDTGNTKSKVLYKNNDSDQQAGVHSQKIGNAIRTIDTWYSDDAQFPIAIEPYGAVTTLGTAFRQPKQKLDFYTLFDAWVLNDEKPSVEQQHYIMAVLIRGGVFGASGKE